MGSGIGGRTAALEVSGTKVFVKRIPVTDLELRPGNYRSTANVFGLPMFYHYGVGSAGFGVWRELAAHAMTTDWVLANRYAGFPLMYHWRIQPDSAVRARLEAIGRSSHSLVVILEYFPHTLNEWLTAHPAPATYSWMDDALLSGVNFLSSAGFVHFDAHFNNVLTDGELVCFADLGLALADGFELLPDEREFLVRHLSYDRAYYGTHLLRYHLPDGIRGEAEHATFLRNWIEGRPPVQMSNARGDSEGGCGR